MWLKQAKFYADIGNLEKAQDFMTKIEQDQAEIAAKKKALEEEEAKKRAAVAEMEASDKEGRNTSTIPSVISTNNGAKYQASNDGGNEDAISTTSSGHVKTGREKYDDEDTTMEKTGDIVDGNNDGNNSNNS